jgi:hypothetical protein
VIFKSVQNFELEIGKRSGITVTKTQDKGVYRELDRRVFMTNPHVGVEDLRSSGVRVVSGVGSSRGEHGSSVR